MPVIPLQNELEVICVPTEFEVDPTSTGSVVVLNVIPNGFLIKSARNIKVALLPKKKCLSYIDMTP